MKMQEFENKPKTRREFERNLNYLYEGIYQGKVHFPSDYIGELSALKVLPNRRTDLSSVSEFIRLNANMQVEMSGKFDELLKDIEGNVNEV